LQPSADRVVMQHRLSNAILAYGCQADKRSYQEDLRFERELVPAIDGDTVWGGQTVDA